MRSLPALALSLFLALPASAYVVNDLGDAPDQTPGDNICATAGAVCTLRAAIQEANAHAGTDPITFSLAGTISPAGSDLPAITDRADIDATTVGGYAGVPLVNLDGGAGARQIGLDFGIGSSSSTVAGLQIHGFSSAAIRIASDGVQVRSNYLGPVSAGTANGMGINLGGSGSTIGGSGSGNVISGNQGVGINAGGSGHFIRGNRIGTNATGTAALANGSHGIDVSGSSITIGGATAGERNLISGNGGNGVDVKGGTGNVVAGNFIGTDAAGTTAVANGAGVRVTASGNTVGTTAARNLITGNTGEGIVVANTSAVVVRNNWVGVDATGAVGIGNGAEGIRMVNSSDLDIGGAAANEGNVVSFNGSDGISCGEATNSRVFGNIVGLNAAGTSILGNGSAGISLGGCSAITIGSVGTGRNIVSGNSLGGILAVAGSSNSVVGNRVGTDSAGNGNQGNLGVGIQISGETSDNVTSNLVSGNAGHGIEIANTSASTTIASNSIGVALNGTAMANSGDGVHIGANVSDTTIGGSVSAGNTIAFNGANGIGVEATATLNNTWAANSIHDNTSLGIDLGLDGVTANDGNDADTGANNLQNFPAITTAVTTGSGSQIRGTIATTANTLVSILAYSTPAADPSGFGEGQLYLGTTSVTTDGSGNANWVINGAASTVGHVATATATAPDGSSEFSQTFAIGAPPTVQFSQATYSVAESGGGILITVTRSGDLTVSSTVQYATSNGTATAGSDYTTATGTLTFNPGDAAQTFNVPITNDTLDENDETVNLTLSNPVMATLGAQSTAVLTITDDDVPPSITINDVSLAEGNSGTTPFVFTISLSAASGLQVQVNYTTTNGSALGGSDYTSTSGTATIPAGSTSAQVTVPVLGDALFEPNETFTVDLSVPVNAAITDNQGLGTIVNDEGVPTITINDVTLAEGNAGTTSFTFTVSLSATSGTSTTVDYATANGTATAPSDYTALPTTQLTIPAGSLTGSITVAVNGDGTVEPDETFFVNLTNASGAAISDNQGLGTITNDDLTADVAIAKTASVPSFTPGQQVTYTITVTNLGPGTATNVTVTDVLPAGTAFVSSTGPCTGTSTVTCTIATLANGGSSTITIVVTATGSTAITNTATVASASVDPAAANNSASVTIAAANVPLIPTLSEWMLLALAAMLAALAVKRM